jgi:hypothetical protein
MQAAVVVSWTHPVVGREAKAVEYGVEVQDYWHRLAQAGECSEPELFLSETGSGIWMVKGEQDTLMRLHDAEQARLLTLKGELLFEGFKLEVLYTGDSAAEHIARYQSALSAIG